jgi:hypothetical protein
MPDHSCFTAGDAEPFRGEFSLAREQFPVSTTSVAVRAAVHAKAHPSKLEKLRLNARSQWGYS